MRISVDAATRKEPGRFLIEVFLYLQVLDILSTMIGFRLGASEASPFIHLLIRYGPLMGLLASKVVAAGLAMLCLLLNRRGLIRVINYWYAALVLWNLAVVLRVLSS